MPVSGRKSGRTSIWPTFPPTRLLWAADARPRRPAGASVSCGFFERPLELGMVVTCRGSGRTSMWPTAPPTKLPVPINSSCNSDPRANPSRPSGASCGLFERSLQLGMLGTCRVSRRTSIWPTSPPLKLLRVVVSGRAPTPWASASHRISEWTPGEATSTSEGGRASATEDDRQCRA